MLKSFEPNHPCEGASHQQDGKKRPSRQEDTVRTLRTEKGALKGECPWRPLG